jgi:diguanylate cyclase (GGDEF)-like protein
MLSPTFNPTIVIVDDDRTNRSVLADLLKDEGRLLLAKDGVSGLQILERERDVSLVLLDVSMPGMSGYEMLEKMRANPAMSDIAVIFITGMAEEADEEHGLLLGAADYVQKPIRPAIVRARVKTHLKLAMQRRALEEMAHYDGLTGIANRRFFDEILHRSLSHAMRTGTSLGLALFDVDHFKQFNDHYGHGRGDDALKFVAMTLHTFAKRPSDLAARYGGEEFVLLMPGIEADQFALRVDAFREEVQNGAVEHARSTTAGVLTISGGALVWRSPAPSDAALLMEQADRLLYQAKSQGRNRILMHPPGASILDRALPATM